MNWARAKTILLVLLIAVNLILCGIWLVREEQVRVREARSAEELCAVLERNGLQANPGQIPKTLALTYDVERFAKEERAVAEYLLGDAEETGRAQYQSAAGTARFHALGQNFFEILLTEGLPSDRLPSLMELLGPDSQPRGTAGDTAVFQQMVEGLPVWDYTALFRQENGLIRSVSGHWLWGEALPINGQPCLSAGYCLLQLTEGWEQTGVLESCELGFTVSPIATDVVRLKPSWRFVISGVEYSYPAA